MSGSTGTGKKLRYWKDSKSFTHLKAIAAGAYIRLPPQLFLICFSRICIPFYPVARIIRGG
ncbi:hypothetical protein OBV_29880 [Oscillibacter valericigenes Sjm18-20]|nr:hypothetical protein OBV_29880 [Oscillibacter valericigenes Sjm18-20]